MKTSLKNISPFIILMIPTLLVVGILAINPLSPEEAEQVKAISSFSIPDMRSLVQILFSIK
jgi:hypothetical protein